MRLTLILPLLFLSLSLSAQKISQPAPPDPVYDSTVVNAKELYSEEKYIEAIKLLEAVPENDTAYATCLDLLALAYLTVDSLDQAIETCQKGLTLKSEWRRHFFELLGASYDEKKDFDKAMETFNKGLAEYPTYTRFWYQMGLTCKTAKKYDLALHYFQKCVQANPYHAGTHLQLSVLYYNSNKMLPTMLAYQMFLLMDDATDKSISVLMSYEKLANGDYNIPNDSIWIKIPSSTDNFDELETIIRSKLVFDAGYKTSIKLPYTNIVKTMQVIGEKLQYNKADTGFCMQFYVPFFLELVKKQQYPASIYYCFRAVNDEAVQKELKKQDAATTKMADAANDYLNDYRQAQWKAMGLSKTKTWFGNSGILNAEGEFDDKADARQGNYVYYHGNSMIKSKGAYSSTGNATGKWEYFFPEGGLQAIKYFKEGELSDSTVTYYMNGSPSEVLHYKDGKLSGEARGYYSTGNLRARLMFSNDMKNGKSIRFHPNGIKESETTYLDDKLNGSYVEFHDNGVKSEESGFKEGMYDGPIKTYYANGKLKSEGAYKAGLAEGTWKYYDEYGNLDSEGLYKADKQEGKWKEYYSNGVLRSEISYSSGKLSGDAPFYDDDGKLWSILTYTKGNLTKFKYVDKTGKVISQGSESGGNLDLKSYKANGNKFKDGLYKKGLLEGKHTEYNNFGKVTSTKYYKEGELDGLHTEFDNAGNKESETHWKAGTKDGLYVEYYKNGIISIQGWFKNGDKRGEWREYNADGTMNESNYFQDGVLQGHTYIYDIKGRLLSDVVYHEGDVVQYTGVDTTGKVLYSEPIKGGVAKFKTLHLNKKPDAELTYKNGSFEGEIKRYYSNGNIRYINNYKNNDKNGPSKRYTWEGKMTENGFYRDGYRDSVLIRYENDIMIMKGTYVLGELEGERTWYYPDGKPEIIGTFVHGLLEGYNTYYAENGMVRLRLKYKAGSVVSYSYLGPDSNWVAEIPLPNSTGPVKAKFRNGNPSVEFNFIANWYDGDYVMYHPNGKVYTSSKYIMHEQDGPAKEYASNGTLIKDEVFYYDELQGTCKYYTSAGILQRVSVYHGGSLHGPTQIYDKTGKLVKTINFYNDEPY